MLQRLRLSRQVPSRTPTSTAPHRDVAGWVYALSLAWWAASWHLRNSVLMAWSPVEPIWIGSLAVALCVVHRLGRPIVLRPAVLAPLVVTAASFVPGLLLSRPDGYGPEKTQQMLLYLLPVVVAATLLLSDAVVASRWAWAQAVVGSLVALAAVEVGDPSHVLSGSRLTLATVDTISTGRLVGAAVVVLLVAGLLSPRRAWWTWPLAAGTGGVLVQVGSRGPLLAVVVSVVVSVAVARCLAGRRRVPLLVGGLVALGAVGYAVAGGGAGGRRIVDSLRGGLGDNVRERLLEDAWRVSWSRPWGVGWGDFALSSPAGKAIANAQGAAYAHNVFAEVLVEGGVLALLGLCVLVVVALVRLHRASGDPRAVAVLALTIYWLINAQVSADVVGNRIMWLMLVCGVLARPSRGPEIGTKSRNSVAQCHA